MAAIREYLSADRRPCRLEGVPESISNGVSLVYSVGARGIDTAAHRGALVAGGRTVAVMGCGLSFDYPGENAELFAQIVAEDRGGIVSELPMRFGVLAKNFPRRNRIISGMSLGVVVVVVVVVALRSGQVVTARPTVEQGGPVPPGTG